MLLDETKQRRAPFCIATSVRVPQLTHTRTQVPHAVRAFLQGFYIRKWYTSPLLFFTTLKRTMNAHIVNSTLAGIRASTSRHTNNTISIFTCSNLSHGERNAMTMKDNTRPTPFFHRFDLHTFRWYKLLHSFTLDVRDSN